MKSDLFDEDHLQFGYAVRAFVDKSVRPKLEQWDADRLIDRETWLAAGKQGLLGLSVPEEYGGPGGPTTGSGSSSSPRSRGRARRRCSRASRPTTTSH